MAVENGQVIEVESETVNELSIILEMSLSWTLIVGLPVLIIEIHVQ